MKVMKYALMCSLIMVLVVGCATGSKKSDEQLVSEQMQVVKKALEAKDIEMLLSVVSDDFEHPEVGSKAEAKDLLQMGVDSGYADDGECNLDSMQATKKDDGTIEVYPVDLSSAAGSVSVMLIFKKDKDGVWRVIGGDEA